MKMPAWKARAFQSKLLNNNHGAHAVCRPYKKDVKKLFFSVLSYQHNRSFCFY